MLASPKPVKGRITKPEKPNYRPHLHRRKFATVAMEAGVLEVIGGRLLNHTPISISGRRSVRPSVDSLRPSMEVACNEILGRIESRDCEQDRSLGQFSVFASSTEVFAFQGKLTQTFWQEGWKTDFFYARKLNWTTCGKQTPRAATRFVCRATFAKVGSEARV